ncbi:aminoglycoside adenylyltransferase [Paenibacillus rhizosphaerae]|uniref:Aminoglycoside adenylyltransferase n=1 Tax=Paenibacillus rhizosphaerae TaxID=297318 RepID=A0A1R1EAQ8_9BACL|nr:aminoglycoside 6-adenylyltransferase [Paenibacillus rhizosphaerae]OMF48901.1 aminoglycoside adenylyltransferase [Paenibacillus rhizosphaerae]
MRSEREMLDLILNVAKSDERIRAAGMNGSRTNPNAPKDVFQDYDIVYVVTDVGSFIQDPDWVNVFGDRIVMQKPEEMKLVPPAMDGFYPYLMLFTDGNRIDLTLCPIDKKDDWNGGDRLAVVLLDKDQSLPQLAEPTDQGYWVQQPTAKLFADCCNEFWWVSPYVAKGLWRQEILYALDHLNIIREMLVKMLEWQAGVLTGFSVSTGKNGKYLKGYIPESSWEQLLATYPKGQYEDAWNALFTMTDLFRSTAQEVAAKFGFAYPHEDDRRVTAYLERVRTLEPGAAEIFPPGREPGKEA